MMFVMTTVKMAMIKLMLREILRVVNIVVFLALHAYRVLTLLSQSLL